MTAIWPRSANPGLALFGCLAGLAGLAGWARGQLARLAGLCLLGWGRGQQRARSEGSKVAREEQQDGEEEQQFLIYYMEYLITYILF